MVIDDCNNGWRRLVLPLAQVDGLVRDAVISASMFGFSTHVKHQSLEPNIAYQKVIRRLRHKQDFFCQNVFERQSVVLTLLLLLAGVIVSGSSDFRIIFRSLESFLSAVDDDLIFTEDELGRFLYLQVQKSAPHPYQVWLR